MASITHYYHPSPITDKLISGTSINDDDDEDY
jgi:hypothetical protein